MKSLISLDLQSTNKSIKDLSQKSYGLFTCYSVLSRSDHETYEIKIKRYSPFFFLSVIQYLKRNIGKLEANSDQVCIKTIWALWETVLYFVKHFSEVSQVRCLGKSSVRE